MTSTVLLLARHGATQANLCTPYTIQGSRPDSDLAEEGMRQARAAAAVLSDFPIVEAYSSPMRRAWQTAEVIVAAREVPLRIEHGLTEVDVGLWAGLSWQEISERWPQEHTAFCEAPEQHGYLGGENLQQVRERVLPVIAEIVARHRGETVLVVGHGVVSRVLVAHWLGVPLRYARRLPLANGGFNIVEFTGGQGRVRTINATPTNDGGQHATAPACPSVGSNCDRAANS